MGHIYMPWQAGVGIAPDWPELLDDFVHVIKLASRTIEGLRAAAGHVAARPLPRMRCYSALDLLQ